MHGRRHPDDTEWSPEWQPGDYAKLGKYWWLVTPNGEIGTLNPKIHEITEHEDGTITVSPSILIYPHQTSTGQSPGWHGYLRKGVWSTA